MDLRTFVSQTLTQIAGGVADTQAQLRAENAAARINPTAAERGKGQRWAAASPVEFDVAVTVGTQSESSSAEKAGGKIGILSVASAGGEVEGARAAADRQEQVSRIKFTVMLAQPADVEEYTMPNFRNDRTGY